MADLAKIQFLRSTVAGKTPTTSQLADGELAINMADYAIYTKNGSSIVQLAGKGIPETNTKKLTVNGPSALNDTVTVAEGKTITFTNADLSGGMVRHITGKNALNDGWYIGSGGESNKGFLEIGTIDDGDEEIRFVSRGSGDTVRRTLKLIDSGGNTRVPGNIYIDEAMGGGGSAFISKNKAYFGAGGADIYMRNTAGGATNQLTITDGGELLFQAKPVYWDGRKPTLTELGIGLVENARQLEQDNFPVITGNDNRWIKVALLKDPGYGQSRLQLMVTNGGNYGSTRSSIDFIDCSARSIPSTLTSSNIRSYLQIRRLGDPAFDNTNQMRYSLVRTSEGLELWFTQRAFIGGVKVALLSIAGGAATEYYLPTGYTTSATAPEGLVESVAIRIYDEMNKPNLDDGTDGILSVAKGGTGASTASAARTNLGLGTAATRDVGTGSGQVMLVGAYGLGGKGTSYSIANARDYLKQLRTDGSQFMRNTLSTDINYGMGASFYSSVSDVHAVISVDWATGRVKVGATNDTNLNSDTGRINSQELYGTAFKPTPDDVGAVARTGDGMTGDLSITKVSPGFHLNAESGNSVIWFKYKGNETGAVWALPNTASSGEVRIRARTSGGTTGGEFSFKSDGTFTSPGDVNITSGAFNGKSVNTQYANFNNTSSSTTEQTVSISGSQHTPLLLNRQTNSNLSIGFKLSGMKMKRLGIDVNGDIRYGEAENQTQNSWLLTSDTVNRWTVNFGRDINVAGVVNSTGVINSTGGFTGPVTAYDLNGVTQDLDALTLNNTEPGHIKVYTCRSMGGGDNITNKPSGVGSNFIVIVECLRKVSDTDYTNRQVLRASDNKRSWERWLTVSGTAKTWSPWRMNVVSGNDDDVSFKSVTTTTGNLNSGNDLIVANNTRVGGNLGLGGASSTKYTDKGVVIGSGSALLESTDGRVIIGSSGGGRAVELRPGGPTQTNNRIKVTATSGSGGDTAIEYEQGAKIRSNNGGALIISAKAGQSIYLRPQGDTSSTNETRIDANGSITINGNINANGTLTCTGGAVNGDLTVSGNVDITGTRLKTWGLEVDGGGTVLGGTIDVVGKANFSNGLTAKTSINVMNDGNSHLFFRKADGTEKGLLYVDDPGNVTIRAKGGSGPTWNFWESGSCQFPGAISNFNGVNSTTNYPGGGIGAYLNTAGLTSRFSNGAYVSLYFQEYVGSYHQAILNVNGYGQDNSFYFRAGGDFICTRNGSFDNVEIRSDRRAKSDIKVIENALEKVEKLTGNTYELHNTSGGTTRSAGLIAQEVQEVLPEAVTQDIEADGGLLRLNYNSVIALLVESVKELSAEVKELKSQLK
ncbi:L-shaped tail fiber protein [Klebsiella phage Kpn35c1]|nr:L-shaped tail fiber protein [Klebsiella phage Kpn35c1]